MWCYWFLFVSVFHMIAIQVITIYSHLHNVTLLCLDVVIWPFQQGLDGVLMSEWEKVVSASLNHSTWNCLAFSSLNANARITDTWNWIMSYSQACLLVWCYEYVSLGITTRDSLYAYFLHISPHTLFFLEVSLEY